MSAFSGYPLGVRLWFFFYSLQGGHSSACSHGVLVLTENLVLARKKSHLKLHPLVIFFRLRMGQGVLATVSQWECLVFLLTYKSVPYITYAIDEMADCISTTTHLPLSYEYCLLRTSIGTLKRVPIKPLQKSELFFNHPWIITYVLRINRGTISIKFIDFITCL